MYCSEIAEYLVSREFMLHYDKPCFILTIIKMKIATSFLTALLTQWRLERERWVGRLKEDIAVIMSLIWEQDIFLYKPKLSN